MERLHKKLYLIFLVIVPIIILTFSSSKESVIDLNRHDTYFIVSHCNIVALISIFFFSIGIIYWLLNRFNIKLMKWMNLIHLLLSIGGLLAIKIISYFSFNGNIKSDYAILNDVSLYNSMLAIVVLLMILGQFIFVINILIGFCKKLFFNN